MISLTRAKISILKFRKMFCHPQSNSRMCMLLYDFVVGPVGGPMSGGKYHGQCLLVVDVKARNFGPIRWPWSVQPVPPEVHTWCMIGSINFHIQWGDVRLNGHGTAIEDMEKLVPPYDILVKRMRELVLMVGGTEFVAGVNDSAQECPPAANDLTGPVELSGQWLKLSLRSTHFAFEIRYQVF